MLKLAEVPEDQTEAQPQRAPLSRIRRARPKRTRRHKHRYYAFLSYSHKDEALADWLHSELEAFHVPRSLAGRLTENGVVPKRLKPIFRDQHELAAADDLSEEIENALSSSQFLIVLCSPSAAKSRWTNAEIETFKRAHPEGCVLGVIASGEPFASEMPGREDEECFPPALLHKYDRRGRRTGKRVEPLAADLREGRDGRRLGFLKLVAGLLGVGLDELIQRESAKRHRRLAWITGGSVTGMLVAFGLAFTAIQARDAAREQRREAEGLVAFMLGDLKDKLEPIGRLDALDGVGSRVLAYYSKQDTSDLSDAALLQRSRALSLTAQVAYLRGNLDGAARLYREAMEGTNEAIRRKPDDPQRLFDHAQNVFWVGELARRRGETDRAEASYREYKRLADRMVAIQPDNLKWRMEVAYANENLGIVLMSQRRFDEAARRFQETLQPMQSLAAVDPANSQYQEEVNKALGWLADAQLALGRLDDAIAIRQKQVGYLERLLGRSSDVALQQQLIPAHQSLGLLYASRGQTDRGISEYRLALAQAAHLTAVEPNNSLWNDMAARARLELARILLSVGRTDQATEETAAGCQATAALGARDRSTARWRRLQTSCLTTRSRLALASGSSAEALSFAQQALAAARSEHTGDPVTDRYIVAAASRLLGDVRERMGDSSGAASAWNEGLSQLPTNATERPWEMSEHAELLRRLGRADAARPLMQRLSSIGYRSVT